MQLQLGNPRPETQGALGLPLAPDGRLARLEGRGSGPKAQQGQALDTTTSSITQLTNTVGTLAQTVTQQGKTLDTLAQGFSQLSSTVSQLSNTQAQ